MHDAQRSFEDDGDRTHRKQHRCAQSFHREYRQPSDCPASPSLFEEVAVPDVIYRLQPADRRTDTTARTIRMKHVAKGCNKEIKMPNGTSYKYKTNLQFGPPVRYWRNNGEVEDEGKRRFLIALDCCRVGTDLLRKSLIIGTSGSPWAEFAASASTIDYLLECGRKIPARAEQSARI